MSETVLLPARRAFSPALLLTIILIAIGAMALGFGIRSWTDSASPSNQSPVVQIQPAPSGSQPITRIGRPN